MILAEIGILWSMPNKGQTRDLSKELRGIVATNLRLLMDQYGLSNDDVGKGAGVGPKTVYRILTEKISTTLDTLEAIATFFKVPAFQLLIHSPVQRQESDKREKFRHPYPKTFGPEHHPIRRRTDAGKQRNGTTVRQAGKK